ncbi:MAG: carboxypeptidase regulatory-like domain-containing protein, partial [Myxococcales bacterium]|nr:carboxypeptidase regulatory-like domain-containing protein [Myxococcales bacterium]
MAEEADPPDEAVAEPSREIPQPRPPSKVRWVLAALALILVLAALWIGRDEPGRDETPIGADDGDSGEAIEAGPTVGVRLEGRVLREVPAEAPEVAPVDDGGDSGDSEDGSDEGSDDDDADGSSDDSDGSDDGGSDDDGDDDDSSDDGSDDDDDSSDEGSDDDSSSDEVDDLDALLAALPAHELLPPLPGTCSAQAWQDGKRVATSVVCDDEGGYELGLAAGVSGTVHIELLVTGHLRGPIPFEVPEQAPTEALVVPTVALGPGFRVSGQTVDARGQPVAGATVQALPRPNLDEPEPWRTVSDEQGQFEFTTLPYGPVSLRAIKTDYALSVVEAISPEDEVLMVLDSLIDLEGSVVAAPELLARAVVRLEGSSVWPAIEQGLAADGSFVFARLPDGIYGVEVTVPPDPDSPEGAQGDSVEFASVPLENITPDLRVSLALVQAFRVPVRVVDPDGTPVAGARVTLSYGRLGMLQKIAETDDAGRARVGPVVPGPYYLRADADGYLPPEELEVEVGSEGWVDADGTGEQVLVLARPATIRGVVVDEHDRPVAGADVLLDSDVEFTVGEGDTRRRLFAMALGSDVDPERAALLRVGSELRTQ